eukprot:Trichotokara_eunicae@DN6353_c3_g2_i2.p1
MQKINSMSRPEEIDNAGVYVKRVAANPLSSLTFFFSTENDEALTMGSSRYGQKWALIVSACATGEVEYGCGEDETAGLEPVVTPKVYVAGMSNYQMTKMNGGAGITEECDYESQCSGVVTRHHFLTEGGDMHAYQ